MYTYIPSILSLPPTLPTLPFQVVTKHQTDLPVLCSSFPLAIYFTDGSAYMSMLLSNFFPTSPSRTVSSSPFSMSVSLFLPCHQVLQYHFSRFHIYMLIYGICFFLFLTYFTVYDRLYVHPHLYKRPNFIPFTDE